VLKSVLDSKERSLDVELHVLIEERLVDICNGFTAHDASGQNENIKASPFRNSNINERFATLDREGVCLDSDSVTLTYGFDVIDYPFGSGCVCGIVDDNVGTSSSQSFRSRSTDGAG